MFRHARFVLPAALAAAAGCVADVSSRPAAEAVSEQVLQTAASRPEGWYSYGRDWSNQRFSPLLEIDRTTVATLRPVWGHDLDLLFRRSTRNESTPLVVGDLLIYTDLKNLVIASQSGVAVFGLPEERPEYAGLSPHGALVLPNGVPAPPAVP